jgi:hypothetical protein
VAKVRDRLAVSKRTAHRVYMERFNLKKLNEVERMEQCLIEISNRFAGLENLDAEVNILGNRSREYKNFSQRQYKLLCTEEAYAIVRRRMLRIIRRKKKTKVKRLKIRSEVNKDNLNNVRREASRHFRNK